MEKIREQKLLLAGIFIAFLFCYMEWGGSNHGFIFQLELELMSDKSKGIESILHPFVLLPLAGQLLLIFSLFQPLTKKWIVLCAILALSVLVLMILFAGLLSLNVKMIASTLPFIILSVVYVNRHFRKSN